MKDNDNETFWVRKRRVLLLYKITCINKVDLAQAQAELREVGVELVGIPYVNHASLDTLAYIVDLDKFEIRKCSGKS